MSMHNSLIEEVLLRNQEQSSLFCGPDASLARKQYRALHPTEILWFKCMDGRLNGALMTGTPVGIIQPVRNIAGSFDLGWPYLGALFLEWVEYAVSHGRRCLPFVTYHWSKSDVHKGCKGHEYNVDKAKADSRWLLDSIEFAFGKEHTAVHPIMVGIETDEDTMVLHGDNDAELNISDELETPEDDLIEKLRHLYPDMHPQILNDLLPLVLGNVSHIRELRKTVRPIQHTMHGEQIICVGRGFDWLHWLNRALIIGPYSFDLAKPIRTAAGIVLDNIQKGLVPERDGALLVTSGVYRITTGSEPRMAELKARTLQKFAIDVIRHDVPELYSHLHVLSGTVDSNTRLFKQIDIK